MQESEEIVGAAACDVKPGLHAPTLLYDIVDPTVFEFLGLVNTSDGIGSGVEIGSARSYELFRPYGPLRHDDK